MSFQFRQLAQEELAFWIFGINLGIPEVWMESTDSEISVCYSTDALMIPPTDIFFLCFYRMNTPIFQTKKIYLGEKSPHCRIAMT